jgi:Mce-associated membrane protein
MPRTDAAASRVVAVRSRGRWVRTAVLLVLVTVAATYSALAVPAALSEHRKSNDRSTVLSVAQKGATALLSYDYRDTQGSLARMQRYAVPALRTRLGQSWPDMRSDIVFGGAVTTAKVRAAAVESLSGRTALVLVYLDQTTRTRKDSTSKMTPFRISVIVQKVDGRWLVAKAQPE